MKEFVTRFVLTALFLAALFLVAPFLVTPGMAQTFEVASIRVNHDSNADPNFNSLPGGRLIATSETLRELIRFTFGVKDFQITGAPGWIDTERYDIDAKTSSGDSSRDLKLLLKTLLQERFGLKSHSETKELTVYSLVIGKSGLKMTRHDEGSGTKARTSCGHMTGGRVTSAVLATMLSRQLERDVRDDTGLPGKYDFELDWTPDTGPCREKADQPGGPSIFTAIQQQLGLRLESGKGPVETLVIDHVEAPSAN